MNMMNRGKYSGDNWGLITPVDVDVEREKLGYDILKDDTIRCADCGHKLVDIIKVKEDNSITKIIKAFCPFCDGESFQYKITGHTYMQATSGTFINNMPTDIIDDVMHINIEVLKS